MSPSHEEEPEEQEDRRPLRTSLEQDERLRALSSLAAGLCEDANIQLDVWEGDYWRWDPLRRRIVIPRENLEGADYGLDYCAGVLSREVGHYFVSRHHLFWLDFPSIMAAKALMNALDQSRVGSWIVQRYPGVAPWLKLSVMPPARISAEAPLFIQFCQAAAHEFDWEGGTKPEQLHPRVLDALELTREARRAIAAIVPPLDPGDDPGFDLRSRYRREVMPALIRPQLLPSRRERLMQWYALQVHDIAAEEVVPVVRPLIEDDLERLEDWLANQEQALDELLGQLDEMSNEDLMDMLQRAFDSNPRRRRRRSELPVRLRRAARRLFEAAMDEAQLRMDRLIRESWDLRDFRAWDRLPRLDPLDFMWEEPRDYNQAYNEVAAQIQELARRLSDILRPRKRMRERAGYPSGRRVDLRKLMQFDADKRRYNELWIRASIPDRRSAAVSLLVDLSGSMSGSKTYAALLGTVLLAETLHRLDVDFTINGFQDVIIPLFPFHSPFDDSARDQIAAMTQEVDGCRPHGNNCPEYNDDGPCLLEAADELLHYPATERILIVISDGLPAGRRSNTNDLRRAVRAIEETEDISLIGLGLGPDTEHVTEFYADSHASIPVESFTDKITELIEQVIL